MSNQELIQLYQSISDVKYSLFKEIRERNIDWRHLAEYGLKAEATIMFRDKHECSVTEAHEAVRSYCSN